MEQYTLIIQSKPIFLSHNGKSYVVFSGVSKTNREEGVRKDTVWVNRKCYCTGNVWQIFKTKNNQDKLTGLSWKDLMIAEQKFLSKGRKVLVQGTTNESEFGKKGMLVTKIEVISNVQHLPVGNVPEFSGIGGFSEKEYSF